MFVNYSHPAQLSDTDFRRKVKSLAARRPFKSATLTTRHQPGSFKWAVGAQEPEECKVTTVQPRQRLPSSTETGEQTLLPQVDEKTSTLGVWDEETPSRLLSMTWFAIPTPNVSGGLRTDPFNSLPINNNRYVQTAVDYYLQTWVPSVGRLPGGEAGMAAMLNVHLPWAMQDAERFEATIAMMLCSLLSEWGGHSETLCQAMLFHRANALNSLQLRLGDGVAGRAIDDTAIHTVCTVMPIDFLLGNDKHIEAHANGLAEMVRLRGGIGRLGLQGILEISVLSALGVCKVRRAGQGIVSDGSKRMETFKELQADLSRRSPDHRFELGGFS